MRDIESKRSLHDGRLKLAGEVALLAFVVHIVSLLLNVAFVRSSLVLLVKVQKWWGIVTLRAGRNFLRGGIVR